MYQSRRPSLIAALFVFSLSPLFAQTTADPAGHWDGSISGPFGEVRIEVDLAKNVKGQLTGTFSEPEKKLRGLPMSAVVLDGNTLTFELNVSGAGTFTADVAADRKAMAGTFASPAGPLAFSLTRTGDARIQAAPKSAAIPKEMEGVWTGTLDVNGGMRAVLRMANAPDGTSTGTLVSVDEHGLEIPVAIVQQGSTLQLDLPMVGASYSGALNAAATELTGTYTTAEGLPLPLTFRRAAAESQR